MQLGQITTDNYKGSMRTSRNKRRISLRLLSRDREPEQVNVEFTNRSEMSGIRELLRRLPTSETSFHTTLDGQTVKVRTTPVRGGIRFDVDNRILEWKSSEEVEPDAMDPGTTFVVSVGIIVFGAVVLGITGMVTDTDVDVEAKVGAVEGETGFSVHVDSGGDDEDEDENGGDDDDDDVINDEDEGVDDGGGK